MSVWSRRLMIVALASVALCGFAAEPQRASKLAAKGYELYSWEAAGTWRYALLFGTNRNKTRAELVAAATDLSTLQRQLSVLTVSEYVFWVPLPDGRSSLPDAEIVADVSDYCKARQLDLTVMPRE
jgi:hypothetical protein